MAIPMLHPSREKDEFAAPDLSAQSTLHDDHMTAESRYQNIRIFS